MKKNRRGYALIEVIVVITVVTVMLALCAGMIHLLLKLDRAGRAASEVSADLARLAIDFRTDVHAAPPLDPPTNAEDRFTMSIAPGKTVEYQVRPREIVRTVREGGKVRRFETYRRPNSTTVRIEVFRETDQPFVALILDHLPDGRDNSLYHNYRIEAELGRDRRLTARSR